MKLKTINTALLLVAVTLAINSSVAFAAEGKNPPLRPMGEAREMGIRSDLKVKISSSTEQRREDRKEVRDERREEMKDLRASTTLKMIEIRRDIKNASSSEMFKKIGDQRQEIVKKMKKGAFEIRKNALVKELNITLDNLGNIRERINTRIVSMETGSTSMSEAKALLAIADDKISKAKTAVGALSALTASSTDDVDLGKPRQVGDVAIKAVKDARDALRDVLKLINPPKANKEGENKDNK